MTPAPKTHRRSFREPLHIPRWILLLKYLGFAFFGVVAYNVGVPRLDLTTPEGYRPIWAAAIVLFALTAALFLIIQKPNLERISLVGLVGFLGVYIYAITQAALDGGEGYKALASVLWLLIVFPAGRFVALLPRGRKVAR